MTDREAMKMALDALECWQRNEDCNDPMSDILKALRAALAQPEPNARKLAKIHQAAWNAVHKDYKDDPKCCFALGFDAGYDAVAQRVEPPEMESGERFESFPASPNKEWVGLTDENIFAVLENLQEMYNRPPTTDSRVIFARAIEAKLKEKNT